MNFWQTNVDHARQAGGGVKATTKALLTAVRSANTYDWNRGRFIQILIYGIDVATRALLPLPAVNVWMMLLLVLNAALIAWTATTAGPDPSSRVNIFCLAWLALAISALTIAPVVLLVMYGKYAWLTFVLAFFVTRKSAYRALWLVLASTTDELGLFAALFILWLVVARLALVRSPGDCRDDRSALLRIARAGVLATSASLTALFAFYGIWAVMLNVGAQGFRGSAYGIGVGHLSEALSNGSALLNSALGIARGLLWRAELLVAGISLDNWIATILIGVPALTIVVLAVSKVLRSYFGDRSEGSSRFDDRLCRMLHDEKAFLYCFWSGILLLISVFILPGGTGDYSHYSYPAAAVLSVVLIMALLDLFKTRMVGCILACAFLVHVCVLPRAVTTTAKHLEDYLFPDHTVTSEDIIAIYASVTEFRKMRRSPIFDSINNHEELDLSGIWYYSRVRADGAAKGWYFPVQGTVRVLLWPDSLKLP